MQMMGFLWFLHAKQCSYHSMWRHVESCFAMVSERPDSLFHALIPSKMPAMTLWPPGAWTFAWYINNDHIWSQYSSRRCRKRVKHTETTRGCIWKKKDPSLCSRCMFFPQELGPDRLKARRQPSQDPEQAALEKINAAPWPASTEAPWLKMHLLLRTPLMGYPQTTNQFVNTRRKREALQVVALLNVFVCHTPKDRAEVFGNSFLIAFAKTLSWKPNNWSRTTASTRSLTSLKSGA